MRARVLDAFHFVLLVNLLSVSFVGCGTDLYDPSLRGVDAVGVKTDTGAADISADSSDSIDGETGETSRHPPPDGLKFRVDDDQFAVWTGNEYRHLFMKGMNLGVGVPGKTPGHLDVSREQYDRWLQMMGDMGINTLRIYTLHDPRFYEEFREYNLENPENPIYLMHGIWLNEENMAGDLKTLTDGFRLNIREAIRCSYGDCQIESRRGKAFGTYTADISPWIIGWIIGREVAPFEIKGTNEFYTEGSYDGDIFSIDDATPSEVWVARQLNYTVTFERDQYGNERPVSFSSWPTLDPLNHPTESSEYSEEDDVELDFAKIEEVDAPAGQFATFHAYPYYPNFVVEEPDYREYSDTYGPNSYLGYLLDLQAHFDEMPLVIGEFGVPSSWGNAHWGYKKLNHGGYDEIEQGIANTRLMQNIYDTNCAGGFLFAWFDEWWKQTWIVNPREASADSRRRWWNIVAPEQNYGLLRMVSDIPHAEMSFESPQLDPIQKLSTDISHKFFKIEIELDEQFEESDTMTVAFDTYADDLGEKILPNGVEAQHRNEFALTIEGHSQATLDVMKPYSLTGIWGDFEADYQTFRSTKSDSGEWTIVRWKNSQYHESEDGSMVFPPTYQRLGQLEIIGPNDLKTSKTAVEIEDKKVRLRIPWTLLHVSDPSSRRVVHDEPETPDVDHRETDGIALEFTLNGEWIAETDRISWPTWERVERSDYREEKKPSLTIYSSAISRLPDWLEAD